MATILRRLLDRITPWHDDEVVDERLRASREEVVRGSEISQKANDLIQQYVLMDTILQRKRRKIP